MSNITVVPAIIQHVIDPHFHPKDPELLVPGTKRFPLSQTCVDLAN